MIMWATWSLLLPQHGNNIGVDNAMFPLVDMMTCEFLDDIVDLGMSYDYFTFPCDDMLVHDAHEDISICNDIAMRNSIWFPLLHAIG